MDTASSTSGDSAPTAADDYDPSRLNGRHGLTARHRLPEALSTSSLPTLADALTRELQPQTPSEQLMVREAARHAAALDRIEPMEESVLRRSARVAMAMEVVTTTGDDLVDVGLAGAAGSEALSLLSRYRRTHERGLHRSLDTFQQLKHSREQRRSNTAVRFQTEAQCQEWLATRLVQSFCCPGCGGDAAIHLRRAKAVQCKSCRRQQGLRTGTVMAGSRLTLRKWFVAIDAVLSNARIKTNDLAELMQVRRTATARDVRTKILEALASEEASQLLAGLCEVCQDENVC